MLMTLRFPFVCLLISCLIVVAGCAAKSDTAGRSNTGTAQQLVDEATATLHKELDDSSKPWLNKLISQAKGIMIIPGMGSVSFFFSVGGGNAVVLARTGYDWTGPVFMTKGSGGIGVQAGVTRTSGLILFMEEDDLRYVLETGAVLQGSASYTFLDYDKEINRTPEFQQTGRVVFVGDVEGLYAGAGINAGGFSNREGLNAAYHEITEGNPEAILFSGKPAPAAAFELVGLLNKAEQTALQTTKEKDGTEVPSD